MADVSWNLDLQHAVYQREVKPTPERRFSTGFSSVPRRLCARIWLLYEIFELFAVKYPRAVP
jgi:hypothetical protein